ncbi:MAG: NUDIX domain-containing protein [Candidatus Heimdallarchaeota archaeon]
MSRNTLQIVVAGLIENPQGEVLLIKRSNKGTSPNFWEDAGGRLLQSEKPEDGLKREISEETGILDIEIVKPLTVFHNYYHGVKTSENEFVGISYWCKTKTSDVKLSDEHTDYQWVMPKQAIDIVHHPAVKQYIKIMLEEKRLAKEIDLLAYEKERLKNV